MSTLSEAATWVAGVYQLETIDLVLGGASGVSNQQGKDLANRTTYLKGQVEKASEDLIKALLGSYTANTLIVLHGCVITGSSTKACTAGAVFYNGQIYKVAAAAGITTSSTWVFAEKTSVTPREVEFKAGASHSGFADWNELIYLKLGAKQAYQTEDIGASFSFNTGWNNAGPNFATVDAQGNVEWSMNLEIESGGTVSVGTLPVQYRPITNSKRFLIADYNGSDGASSFMILEIMPSGVVTIVEQGTGAKPGVRGAVFQTIKYNINY